MGPRRGLLREKMVGFVVWLTGLSGAGKSTLASLLTQDLTAKGVHVECLDGDEVRKNLSHGLGFAREDRDRNVRRIGYVARMVARSGACAITAAISPYEALREEIRRTTENFIEVYCECPLDVLTERDPKGLYKRALAGEIKNFTGVNDPYEAPQDPEVHLRTDLMSPEECLERIVNYLDGRGLLRTGQRGLADLPPPFGGEVFEARRLAEEDKQLPPLVIDSDLRDQVRFVAAGFTSPLSGFMSQREAVKVLRGSALERGTPWWDRAFVLPLSPEAEARLDLRQASAKPVLLTCDGEAIARVTIEDVWQSEQGRFASGPIDAVAGLESTARALRRKTAETPTGHGIALFSQSAPTAWSGAALRGAQFSADHIALFVPTECAAAWQAHCSDVEGVSLVTVPQSIPFGSHRARTVIAKSIGAVKAAELES